MRLLFIISGSIAIHKSLKVLEKITKKNIIIDCIITDSAKKMIDVKLIKKIIKGDIYFNSSEKKNKMLHIKLTRNAKLVIVSPATANIIAKYANGYADDLASTSLIASNKQILFVPAMNMEMWNNKINQNNVLKLQNLGVEFVGPEYGKLSCGEKGLGRLSNANKIYKKIIQNVSSTQIFKDKKCLITAGPTIEPIDPIRYISNHSSGKQGYEIAKQMVLSGAKVTLITGPTNIQSPYNVKLIKVNTAKEMEMVSKKNSKVDIAFFTAAVSDFSPIKIKKNKIKKTNFSRIDVKKNVDILKSMAFLKKNRPKFIVGFAAETNDHLLNAKKKLIEKKCDMIVVNKIDKKNQVFGSDFNKVSFINKEYSKNYKKMSKVNVAKNLIKFIEKLQII